MGKIGHLSQIWMYSEESVYRRVVEELMAHRAEMSRALVDQEMLQQIKDYEEQQNEELGGFAENTAENMERLAVLDTLTVTYNARSFLRELDQTLKHAWRYSKTACLCMVSIDGWEEIEQQYGPLTANSVLRICADAIKRTVRPSDVLARYAGSDFAVVFPNTSTASATIVAERIRETLGSQVITHNWNNIKLTGSLGIASYPGHAYDRDELISIALQALYVSKSRGGDRVCTI